MSIFPSATRVKGKGGKANPSPLRAQVIGIVLVTFGLLMFLSLVSFVPEDRLLFDEGQSLESLAKVLTPPHNLIGAVGSTLAFLLFALIGGAAYLLPFFFVTSGIQAMVGEEIQIKPQNILGSILAIVTLSALFQFRLTSVPILSDGIVAAGVAGGMGGQMAGSVSRTQSWELLAVILSCWRDSWWRFSLFHRLG